MAVIFLCPKCGAEIDRGRSKAFIWCVVCQMIVAMEWLAKFNLPADEKPPAKYSDGYE